MSGPLRVVMRSGVAEVTIDHPPSNIFDRDFTAALAGVVDRCEADAATRVMLVHSADRDFFCMHGDVRAIIAMEVPPGNTVTAANPAAALLQRIHQSRIVSVAAIDGAARGGGAELVSAFDLRVGGPRAVFAQPEAAMGILPGAGGTSRLPHLLGRSRALDVILTGRDVRADEAFAIGWLDRLVPSEDVVGEAEAIARRIASMPGEAVAAIKAVVGTTLSGGDAFGRALIAESAALAHLVAGGGHRARMQRFLDAGGQTREAERDDFERLVVAMLEHEEGR